MHEFAKLNGRVTFVGLGRRFEIWNPELLEERRDSILTLARESRHILKTINSGDVR
jgi:MraZ protein